MPWRPVSGRTTCSGTSTTSGRGRTSCAARRLRGRLLAGLAAAGAVFAAGVGIGVSRRPADLGGRWQLPDGNIWHVRQDGDRLRIEDAHYQTHEVWRRGEGRVSGEGVDVTLTYVLRPDLTLRGRSRLEARGRAQAGNLAESRGDRAVNVRLRRRCMADRPGCRAAVVACGSSRAGILGVSASGFAVRVMPT